MELQTFETGEAMVAQHRAEIDIQISTAKHYPRVIETSLESSRSMIATSPEIASGCFYSLTKGGKIITGPSIRLAEILMVNWGNLNVGGRVIDESEEWITVQGVAQDMQNNVRFVSEVRRRIKKKDGNRYSMDVIQTTIAAATAIAIRNAVFKVVPRVFIDELDKYSRQKAIGKKENIKQRIENALIHFRNKYDVSPELICRKLEVDSVDKIKAKQLEILLGIATSLQENSTTIENEFHSTIQEPQEKGDEPKQDSFLDTDQDNA